MTRDDVEQLRRWQQEHHDAHAPLAAHTMAAVLCLLGLALLLVACVVAQLVRVFAHA